MTIEAVLFDAADTLFTMRGSVGEIYGYVAREYGCTASFDEIQATFVRHFRHSGPRSTTDEKTWWRNVVHQVFSEVGMIRDFNRFFEKVYDQFRDSRAWMLFPETLDVLAELRQRKLKLGIISNFDSRVYGVMTDLGISSFFDSVTISSETGYAKPEPEIFLAAANSLQLPPNSILLVGDSLRDDVIAGAQAGLRAVLIDRNSRHTDVSAFPRIESLRQVSALL